MPYLQEEILMVHFLEAVPRKVFVVLRMKKNFVCYGILHSERFVPQKCQTCRARRPEPNELACCLSVKTSLMKIRRAVVESEAGIDFRPSCRILFHVHDEGGSEKIFLFCALFLCL